MLGARILRSSTSPLRAAMRALGTAPVSSEKHMLDQAARSYGNSLNELFPDAPSPLQEFSVVYTDRALNHMSAPFIEAMNDISSMLKEVYKAQNAVIIPGSGSYAMEACARQFVRSGEKALVIRNGFFSFRWSQIFDSINLGNQGRGDPAIETTVLSAQPIEGFAMGRQDAGKPQYRPPPIDEVVARILDEKPAAVFAPHVETSTGMILPNYYIQRVAEAAHAVGGLMVLDCIASGTVWVDMERLGVDALISAPQKGWTGPSCAGLVMLSPRGAEVTRARTSDSFVCDLGKWLTLMDAYEKGGFMYHATMPTDALVVFRDVMCETKAFGFDVARQNAWELGMLVRAMMQHEKGLVSVAAPPFQAPGVIVVHTDDAGVAGKFIRAGTQIAAGVPFMIGEPKSTQTFRIGLFGLDKLKDPERTAQALRASLDAAVPEQLRQYLSGYVSSPPEGFGKVVGERALGIAK